MPINPNNANPISKDDPTLQTFLANLQGNILKGHGRDYAVMIFVRFKPGLAGPATSFIKSLALSGSGAPVTVTSAKTQLEESTIFASEGILGTTFCNVFFTGKGYSYFSIAVARTPNDPKFLAGMKASQATLFDPPVTTWESGFQQDVHVMILIADDSKDVVDNCVQKINLSLRNPVANPLAELIVIETGEALRNSNGDGIEHFGYVDGASQPLFINTDINDEKNNIGTNVWDPFAPLDLGIVPDPGVTVPPPPAGQISDFCGSYFVFRKLEQNVRGFKKQEQALADAMGLIGADRARAGAQVVGRFEDGTPLTLQMADGMHNPVPNNFVYKAQGADKPTGDETGIRCPFQAHIRKLNPRGESPFETPPVERTHRIIRRGIPYGKQTVNMEDNPSFDDMPIRDVGLLFMCFQKNLSIQFEFMQSTWANNPVFAFAGTGIDPVIGQFNAPPTAQNWPINWGDSSKPTVPFSFNSFVRLRGGEYFFAPSISFLQNF